MTRSAAVGVAPLRLALALASLTTTLGGCDAAAPERLPDSRQIGLPVPKPEALPAPAQLTAALAAASAAPAHAVAGPVPNGQASGDAPTAVVPAATPPLDVTSRLVALERWAQDPNAPMNVVTTAMVDPDEGVRERAQQLFEEALATRR